MRTDNPDFLSTVRSTTVGDKVEAIVYRGTSTPVSVELTGWSLAWDTTRQVQGQATLEIADPDGTLTPWGYGDLLGSGGSRIDLTWVSGQTGIRVPLGVWRIRRPSARQQWRVYERSSSIERVHGGSKLTVQADEITAAVLLDRLDAVPGPDRPTAIAEIERLLDGILPVRTNGMLDHAAPRVVYTDSRMDAIEMMLSALDADHRLAPDGSFELVSRGSDPVWEIAGGDGGALIELEVSLSDEAVYNAAVSIGQDNDGAPLVGRAYMRQGPLAYGGPYGKVPVFHQAVATTQAGVNADAQTVLETKVANAETTIQVECLTNPALQPHDVVTVISPTVGEDAALTGRVVSMKLVSTGTPGAGAVVPAKRMSLGVAVSVSELETAARKASRGRS